MSDTHEVVVWDAQIDWKMNGKTNREQTLLVVLFSIFQQSKQEKLIVIITIFVTATILVHNRSILSKNPLCDQ
jgi:hypothetical protein